MSFKVNVDGTDILLKEKDLERLDITSKSDDTFHLLSDNKGHHIKVLAQSSKNIILDIGGNEHEVVISDEYDQLVDKMGLSAVTSQKMSSVKAPMPGLVLDILVQAGEEVAEGTPLAILEAMKMENVLKASGEGVVKSIEVEKGAAVEKGAVLIEME